ncbi:MAG TPA: hypothetical protein VHQ65_11020 [Thermoanaerobaculia bacterium]|nr:hypothetical protein [Thermoanaerobaculia bacterium]
MSGLRIPASIRRLLLQAAFGLIGLLGAGLTLVRYEGDILIKPIIEVTTGAAQPAPPRILTIPEALSIALQVPRREAEPEPVVSPPPPPPPRGFVEEPLATDALEGWLVVLTQEYAWRKGKDAAVELAGQAQPPEVIVEHLRRLQDQMKSASHLIAVGMASAEGAPGRERQRALARTKQLAVWLTEAVPPGYQPNVWRLNLGQYTGAAVDSPEHRRIVILMVTPRAGRVLAAEALLEALRTSESFGLSLDRFTDRELVQSREVVGDR